MRSSSVALLLAITVIAACSRSERTPAAPAVSPTVQAAVNPPPPRPAPAYFRDHYARLADCVHDWGYAQKCTPVVPGPEAIVGASFMGPIYARSYREETQLQLRRQALEAGYVQRVATESSDRSIAKSEVKS